MPKATKPQVDVAPTPPPVSPPAAVQGAPPPLNRMVSAECVRVRARYPIAEIIGGNIVYAEAGQEFDLPKKRAKEIESLIEPV